MSARPAGLWRAVERVIGTGRRITHERVTRQGWHQLRAEDGTVYHRPPHAGGGYVELTTDLVITEDGSVAHGRPEFLWTDDGTDYVTDEFGCRLRAPAAGGRSGPAGAVARAYRLR